MARGKSHVRIAFYTIVAVHLLVIGGLLILGCKRDDKDKEITGDLPIPTNDLAVVPPFGSDPAVVTPAPAGTTDTNLNPPPTIESTAPPLANTGLTSVSPLTPPTIQAPPSVTETVEPLTREHVIVRNDTFGSLAAKYGVSVRAIQAANPGVDPTRLRIGQKVKIPAASATAARNGGTATPGGASTDVYVVKSGDNLGRIAAANGTTVRELQRLNNLSTTQIRVGQKLKLPPRSAPAPGGAAPIPAPAQ
jgi:LysM repeat protein